MSLLDPLIHVLAAVLAGAHTLLAHLGADPGSGPTWLLAIAAVVVVVRVTLLPLTVHGVRLAHAAAAARPHLQGLADRYRGRTDPESIRELMAERRRVGAEHGVSRLGCLPVLAQLPIWLGLYRLLAEVAGGHAVGAMTATLVVSLGGATVLGVELAERGYLGASPVHVGVVAGLAGVAAALSYATQRWFVLPNTVTDAMPASMVQVQQLLPAVSAAGLLVAAGVVPVALLAYWVCSSLWTLGQAAVIWRFFPTPGSAAALRRSAAEGG